jgi:hypothetical protein
MIIDIRVNKLLLNSEAAASEYSLTGIFNLGYIQSMNSTWSALAEPNRLHIVKLLRSSPLTVELSPIDLGLGKARIRNRRNSPAAEYQWNYQTLWLGGAL